MSILTNCHTPTYLYNHTSQETARVVEDYPWGFRLRTTIRYWIETKRAKNGGQRFGSQTIDPRTGKWCAPKYSTYSPIMVMFLDENEHIMYCALRHNDTEERVLAFKEKHLEHLDDFQRMQLKEIMAYTEVMKHVTFTFTSSRVGAVSLLSTDPEEVKKRELIVKEQEEWNLRDKKCMDKINRAIGYEMSKITL